MTLKWISFFLVLLINFQLYGQKIETDVFDNLVYTSENEDYKATFKKDIFDNLIFEDNRKNKITLEKEYLDVYYPDIFREDKIKIELFYNLLNDYSHENEYSATYSIDIFDKIIIKDNRKNKIEIGEDIFGNRTYEENFNGLKSSIERDVHGNLVFKSKSEKATLEQDIFKKWIYKDSQGNTFEFGKNTWEILKYKYGNEEGVFLYLINEFLRY